MEIVQCPNCYKSHSKRRWNQETAIAFNCSINDIIPIEDTSGMALFCCPSCKNMINGVKVNYVDPEFVFDYTPKEGNSCDKEF